MPLYNKNKICLIHIPKCGGTTFTFAMKANLKDEVSYYDNTFKPSSFNDHSPQHSTYLELKNIIPADYEIFAVIRDPYERFLSEYKWRIKRKQIKESDTQESFAIDLFTSKNKWWDNHEKSQSYFIAGGENLIKLIRIEEMQKFFLNKFKIKIDIKNTTKSEPSKISDAAKKIVDNYWSVDFNLLKK